MFRYKKYFSILNWRNENMFLLHYCFGLRYMCVCVSYKYFARAFMGIWKRQSIRRCIQTELVRNNPLNSPVWYLWLFISPIISSAIVSPTPLFHSAGILVNVWGISRSVWRRDRNSPKECPSVFKTAASILGLVSFKSLSNIRFRFVLEILKGSKIENTTKMFGFVDECIRTYTDKVLGMCCSSQALQICP